MINAYLADINSNCKPVGGIRPGHGIDIKKERG